MTLTITPPQRIRRDLKMRMLRVVRATELSPRMRRVVLGGDDLAGFASPAPDDHIKLFFPAPGEDRPTLPTVGPNGPEMQEGATRPIARDYTPRRFDAAAAELTIDFVLHGDGPASTWAAQARPGDYLGVGGPRGSLLVSDAYDTYLLVGDETALPAVGRWLETLRPGARAIALIEVADAGEECHLPSAAHAAITWLHRVGRPAGTGTLLRDALRATPLPVAGTYAWLAGEIDAIRALRADLLEERGLPRDAVRAAGYWRIGKADAHTRIED